MKKLCGFWILVFLLLSKSIFCMKEDSKEINLHSTNEKSFTDEERHYLQKIIYMRSLQKVMHVCDICEAYFYSSDDLEDHRKNYMHI